MTPLIGYAPSDTGSKLCNTLRFHALPEGESSNTVPSASNVPPPLVVVPYTFPPESVVSLP